MNVSNSSAKENSNVESKNENESEIHDESQKLEIFYRFFIQYLKIPF